MGELTDCLQGIETGVNRVASHVRGIPVEDVLLLRGLKLVGEGLSARLEEMLKPYGLNDSDFRALMQLYSDPQGSAFPSELCAFAAQTPTNMTRIADALVARGLVTRTPNQQDRRRIELRITPAGRRFAAKLLPALSGQVVALLADLSAKDKRTLSGLLQRIAATVDAAAERGRGR